MGCGCGRSTSVNALSEHKKDMILLTILKRSSWQSNGCCTIPTSVTKAGLKEYPVVTFNGRSFKTHRVIAELFFRDLKPGELIMHSCDNPQCINPAHLTIGTPESNTKDCVLKKRHKPADNTGSKNGMSILNESKVKDIRLLASQGVDNTRLSLQFGVAEHTVYQVVKRMSWKHV